MIVKLIKFLLVIYASALNVNVAGVDLREVSAIGTDFSGSNVLSAGGVDPKYAGAADLTDAIITEVHPSVQKQEALRQLLKNGPRSPSQVGADASQDSGLPGH